MRFKTRINLIFLRRSLALLVSLVLLLTSTGALADVPRSPKVYRTANNIVIQAGLEIPVFKLQKPNVTGRGTQALSNIFVPLVEQEVHEDSYLGNSRFTVANEATNTLLEQFGATGGFYAFNPEEAYSETPRGALDPANAQLQACRFVLNNKLAPQDSNSLVTTPLPSFCDHDFNGTPVYNVIQAFSQTEGTVQAAESEPVLIALIVQMPMSMNTGRYSQIPSVPLGGPGGHISLLFNTTEDDKGFSLDPRNAPGLSSVAMPFYSRQLDLQQVRLVPSRDMEKVKQEVSDSVRASYPGADSITVPDPSLVYWVSDAAQPQTTIEPTFEFEGVVASVNGEDITLRNIVVPAVEGGSGGLGPTVAIQSPENGATYAQGQKVTFAATITDGTPPYHFVWSLDDGTILGEGDSLTGGNLELEVDNLPAVSHMGYPSAAVVTLSVTDGDAVTRMASVSLSAATAPSVWLPFLGNGPVAAGMIPNEQVSSNGQVEINLANYSFGVESGSDYPPYGPGGSDLPGVVPDAGGFRTQMLSYGWTQKFFWANANAWEKDWRDCSLGGIDCTFGVDRVDFAYWAGHGSNGGISLPSNKDSSWFPGSNARYQTLRWAGFASCLTLRAQWSPASSAPIRQWFNAFQGAHMLLGYNSLMADVAFGPRLVDNMRMPSFFGVDFPWAQLTIRQAWVQTAFEMNAGKPAYIYAVGTNGVNPVNNKLPKPNDPILPRPYPVASYHWVWWND